MSDNGVIRERLRVLKARADEGVKSVRRTHDSIRESHEYLGAGIDEMSAVQSEHLDITMRLLDMVEALRSGSGDRHDRTT